MRFFLKKIFTTVPLSLVSGLIFCGNLWSFDYSRYNKVLKIYVNSGGYVNYGKLKESRGDLDKFVKQLGSVERGKFASFANRDKVAFWINAYNAFTLKAIVDNYPIKSSFLKSVIYPKNSIRQIAGVWDKLKFRAAGRNVTLDQIEHSILRKKFKEPRIHLALVCASIGCPILRREAFVGRKLEKQFKDQAGKFLKKRKYFRILKNKNRVYISSIFDWFGKDFVGMYGTSSKFRGKDRETRAVLNFISRHASKTVQDYLANNEYTVRYLKYNWALNEWK